MLFPIRQESLEAVKKIWREQKDDGYPIKLNKELTGYADAEAEEYRP